MFTLENTKIQRGNYVGVVDPKYSYTKYTKFIINHVSDGKKMNYLGRFAYGHEPHITEDILSAYAVIDVYNDGMEVLYIIEDMNDGALYIVEKAAIKKFVQNDD